MQVRALMSAYVLGLTAPGAGAAPAAHGNGGAGDPQSVGTALHTASSSHRGGKI